jgi:adenylate cyclase
MPTEIERKFLVIDERWRDAATHCETMRQGYLASNPNCSIRVRVSGARGYLNIKSATLGVQRHEFEYEVPVSEATTMLGLFCQNRCVEKVRHYVPHGGHIWEIDVFEGANQGLIVAEIELTAVDELFLPPVWLGAEVSHDKRYYNVCLLDNPYNKWGNST